jgi:hypothetical protein
MKMIILRIPPFFTNQLISLNINLNIITFEVIKQLLRIEILHFIPFRYQTIN